MRKMLTRGMTQDGIATAAPDAIMTVDAPNEAPASNLKNWRTGVNGNWDNAGKWVHKGAPNSLDRVEIAAAGAYTVTVDTADYAQSVVLNSGSATLLIAPGANLDVEQSLDVQAGTLALADGGSLSIGTTLQIGQAGTLLETGTGVIGAVIVDSGTIDITAGVLQLSGGGTIDGTVTGQGAIDFAGGTFTSSATALADAGGLQISNGATLLLGGASGLWQDSSVDVSSGTIAIAAGATLTLGGNVVFGSSNDTSNGDAVVSGTLITSGQTSIDSGANNYGFQLASLSTWINSGTVEDNGEFFIDAGNNPDSTNVTNTAGAFFIFTDTGAGNQSGGSNPNALFTNLGVLADASSTGTVYFSTSINNTGLIQLEGGTFDLAGGGIIDGEVAGGGTLGLAGTYTSSLAALGDDKSLAIYVTGGSYGNDTGQLTLTGSSGTFQGILGTDGHDGDFVSISAGMDVTLAGRSMQAGSDFTGAGTWTTAGKVTVSGDGFGVNSGGTTWINTGNAIEKLNAVQVSAATIINQSGATMDFTNHNRDGIDFAASGGAFINNEGGAINLSGSNFNLAPFGGDATLTNSGTINTTESCDINGAFDNSGVVDLTGGSLSLTNNDSGQSLTGIGTIIDSNGGTVYAGEAVGSGQSLDFAASTGLLDLGEPLTFLADISGFGGSAVIDLINQQTTGCSFADGTLTVVNGGSTVANLLFTGNYTTSDFALTSDNHGGTNITYV